MTTEAFVPIQTRSERPTSFEPADFPEPSIREFEWKFAPVERLAPLFANEAGDAEAVTVDTAQAESAGIRVGTGEARGEFFEPEDRASAVAWQQSGEGLALTVREGVQIEQPVIVTLTGQGEGRIAHDHLVIEAGKGSEATIVLVHRGSAVYGQNVEILVRENAHLNVVTLQDWEPDAIHASAHQARVDERGYLKHVVISFGGGVVRVNPSVRLAGEGSETEIYGLSFTDSGQHIESNVFMFHDGESTKGNVLYKGALQGAGARSVWVGDVLIGPDAVGTDSYEKNQNLVLTDGARADSIPNLEIENGNIEGAGHASATGRFDDEQLFYLTSRGIPTEQARRLVVVGFLMEIVQKIGSTEVEERIAELIEEELAAGEGLAPATKVGR